MMWSWQIELISKLFSDICIEALSLLEVDDAPDGIQVVGLDVFVLEVECMLPDVDPDNWDVCCGQGVSISGKNMDNEKGLVGE
jgi:hypothetical protein